MVEGGMETLKVAVVGAGPAGLYTAEALTYESQMPMAIDVLDALPTPFGLLRYGVAPDHLKMKSLAAQLQRSLDHPQVRFLGNVVVGRDVSVAELRERYHAVIYAFGAASDRLLGIPGEELPGSIAARELVAWYSGHPDSRSQSGLLRCPEVAVVGMGNVALDVARILGHPAGALRETDVPRSVLDDLDASQIEVVHVVGRGGPPDAKFGYKELRELATCPGIQVEVATQDLDLTPDESARLADDPVRRRIYDLLVALAQAPAVAGSRSVRLHFRARPTELIGADRVGGLRLEGTGTGNVVRTLNVGAVVRAAGYRGSPIEDVPFDDLSATVPTSADRVLRNGAASTGEYATGWIGRGPVGLIGANRSHGHATAGAVIADAPALLQRRKIDQDLLDLLRDRDVEVVAGEGWRAIDEAEQVLGQQHGIPRTKIVERDDLLREARGLVRRT